MVIINEVRSCTRGGVESDLKVAVMVACPASAGRSSEAPPQDSTETYQDSLIKHLRWRVELLDIFGMAEVALPRMVVGHCGRGSSGG